MQCLFQVWPDDPRFVLLFYVILETLHSFVFLFYMYYALFGKVHPDHPGLTLRQPMLTLLTSGKTVTIVCSLITDIVEKLVTTVDYGASISKEEEKEPICIKPAFAVDGDWLQWWWMMSAVIADLTTALLFRA